MSETISSTTEEWKAIPGYEGRYEASNIGRGENHYGHKLTEDAIHHVRRLRREGKSQQAIADKFGVVQTTISKILHGHKWKHVKSTP